VLICVQAAVGFDMGNCAGSDDATVGGPTGYSHRPSSSRGLNCVDCVQAAVGVDVGNRPGPDDATVGGPTGNSHRPSSSRGLLQASQHKLNKKPIVRIKCFGCAI
jgi:hypothetical protein